MDNKKVKLTNEEEKNRIIKTFNSRKTKQGEKRIQNRQNKKQIIRWEILNKMFIILLKINGLNTWSQKIRLSDWFEKKHHMILKGDKI